MGKWALALNKRPIAFFITGLFMALAVYSWWLTRRYFNEKVDIEKTLRSQKIEDTIQERITIYVEALNYILAAVRSIPDTKKSTFEKLIKDTKIIENYPGLQGIGLSRTVYLKDLDSHISAYKNKTQNRDYKIFPRGQRSMYVPCIFMEPDDWRNHRAIGFDLYSEKINRDTMDMAAAKNAAAITPPVFLIQETQVDKQYGFIIYMPIDLPLSDPYQRMHRRHAQPSHHKCLQ
jgi:CHASE1-domain containing sensor protein